LDERGIHVTERLSLHVGQTVHNAVYLDTKSRRMGHW
jgi:GTP cyclohydrolase II